MVIPNYCHFKLLALWIIVISKYLSFKYLPFTQSPIPEGRKNWSSEATIFAIYLIRNFQNHFGQLWWATKSPRRRRVCQFLVAQNRWERNRLHWSNLLVYFDMAWNIRRFDVKHAILATSIGGITFSFFVKGRVCTYFVVAHQKKNPITTE